jgi:hypothetical protein
MHRSVETPLSHYCERWEDMVDGVNTFFEWAVANRLNRIEWLLLGRFVKEYAKKAWLCDFRINHY